jgi:4-amino-4-deoxy-L-arabinose transferase-like glycosyltransferase
MNAVYVVMPLLAAIAIWCTYRLGVQLAGPVTGLGAALLLCTSPAFFFQLLGAPMSDIPAAAWWALALTLLLKGGRGAIFAAGIAAGLAILTRPNLLAVVVVLGLYLRWLAVTDREHRRARLTALALFSLPVVAACLVVAALNDAWYGSPLRSGYSADLFNMAFWKINVLNYPRWLTESQTPLLLVGFAAPFVVHWLKPDGAARRPAAWLLAGVAMAVFASYLFYQPFGAWWFLRFLLPGFPALAVLTCVAVAAVATRLGASGRAVAIALVIAAAFVGYRYEKDIQLLGEYRYRMVGEWVRDNLPERSIVLAMQHSGSVLHYAGRPIVRYDLLSGEDYEAALDEMIQAGYHPYLVADGSEIEQVRERRSPRSALDGVPIAILPLGNVTIWNLAEDRDAARRAGREPVTLPVPSFIRERVPF